MIRLSEFKIQIQDFQKVLADELVEKFFWNQGNSIKTRLSEEKGWD